MLATNYVATLSFSFESIEHIMREVPFGYIIRYLHSNGAAIFFFLIYFHIARGIIYGSYTKYRLGT